MESAIHEVANDTFSLLHGFNTYIFRFKMTFMRFRLIFSSSLEFDISQIALFILNLGEIQDNDEYGMSRENNLISELVLF